MRDLSVLKKAVISSVIMLIVVLTILVGTTWALFTSDPTKGTVGINTLSGSVKVAMVDDKDQSLEGQCMQIIGAEDPNEVLWEPGATFVTEAFLIKNIGTVDMKCMFFIEGTEAENEFLDAFEFWITDDPETLQTRIELGKYMDVMKPNDVSEEYYLVIRMKEEADNRYQGKSLTGVGITVYAIQANK